MDNRHLPSPEHANAVAYTTVIIQNHNHNQKINKLIKINVKNVVKKN